MKTNVVKHTVVIFMITMMVSGSIYRMLNFAELPVNFPKEISIIGISLLVSFGLSLILNRKVVKQTEE